MKQNSFLLEVTNQTEIKKIKKRLKKLNIFYIKSNEKVAYYYENLTTHQVFSYNPNMTFYAASTIKILVAIYIIEKKISLQTEIEIKKEDIKQGSGTIKNEEIFPKKYTIEKLLELTLRESDNTAYLKLVNWIGPNKIKEYGKSLGAIHPLEGKDLYGITTCNDLQVYWKKIIELNHPLLLDNLKYPSKQMIDPRIMKHDFFRKYGSFDVACHEAGVVMDWNPYILILMTQKGENKKTIRFMNRSAKKIRRIHKIIMKYTILQKEKN